MFTPSSQRRSPPTSLEEGRNPKILHVYDCRSENETFKSLQASGLDYNAFLLRLRKAFEVHHDIFVLVTTDRIVLDFDKFEKLPDGSTLYLLKRQDQALSVAIEERIMFTPHYNTLIKSGIDEYYTSEGRNSLCAFSLAELIDNALSATAKNTGTRTIEIRLIFDETLGKPAVIVLDNGSGMTSKQLNNWAVYRLSKFNRDNKTDESSPEGYVRPDPVPRSLNSDISYFGVGGKRAVFYIGESARMISRAVGSPDVHEMVLSKEEFEKKEKNKKDVYMGTIRNRKPGDSSHVNKASERFLNDLIAEELGKESFTAVVITGLLPDRFSYLKQHFNVWTRQLAHTYHYYIHGVSGNILERRSTNSDLTKIDIQITLREKPPRCPRVINLREVDDDMQTLYINTAGDTFEFKASTKEGGTVEGVLRYHPFLYDKETYPKDPSAVQAPCDDGEEFENESRVHQARMNRPIFECFWNGRLIPYTKIEEFDWCSPSNSGDLPQECYNRLSGVLFTDDYFNVTTNKLTFLDLELKLKEKTTFFTCVINGQKSKRGVKKEFTEWLKKCHENLDKQVKFSGFKKTITRADVAVKKLQYPWATFSSIEWESKIYTEGQLVKSKDTKPILYGEVIQFLLHGDHKNDVFATGGHVEIALEPKALYNKTKFIPISKIDRMAMKETIEKNIENDSAKLPYKLKVEWPEDNPWSENDVHPAGTPLGSLRIDILNKKGESMSRMPTVNQATVIKLAVKLRVVYHDGPNQDEEIVSLVAKYSAKWCFWFTRIDNLINLGKYTLFLNAIIADPEETVYGGRPLPSCTLKFTIKEGSAASFTIGSMSSTVRVGVPFDLPLQIHDPYGHSAKPPSDVKPVLKCSNLELSYETVKTSGTTFIIKNVKARGKVLNYQQSKTYDLKVTLPGLKKDTDTMKISLLPGNPHSLQVKPDDDLIPVENGKPVTFNVEIHDEVGNITANPKQIVRCQVSGHQFFTVDCSNTGAGQLKTKPINIKITKKEPPQLKVQLDIPSHKNVLLVFRKLKVMPSTRVSVMELSSQDGDLVMKNNEKIQWQAGGLLENLVYKLYDEAGRKVPLTDEIASMIKVNWTPDVNLTDLVLGKLPDIQVPTHAQDERFYQVSYQDQSVSVSFTIVPHPDEPVRLKATSPQSTVKLGETFSENINLELVDQYDNQTKTLTSICVNHINVEAEGLDTAAISFIWQESSSSVTVRGVCFQSGPLGPKEMRFTYKDYEERVVVRVTAGDPAMLKLINEPSQPLQVLNDCRIPTPFLVQLFDKWGNPSSDQRVVVELKSLQPALKLTTDVASQPVNAEGKAYFTVKRVSGPRGSYQLEFRGSFNSKPIPGSSVNLTVLPDPQKPVSLLVEYDCSAPFLAGGTFPVFLVTVTSEDERPITSITPAALSMFLWEGEQSETSSPAPLVMKCSKPMGNERKDCFHFRDKEIPQHAGKHTIQFSLSLNKTEKLFSELIPVNVVANQPVKLGPGIQPPAPVVSYSKSITSRTLVNNMTLQIMDSYGNPAGWDLDGAVLVSIKSSGGESNSVVPLFEGRTNTCRLNLVKGKVDIDRLVIMENSPGEDSSAYILLFQPEVPTVPNPLAPFELTFRFYNDAESQKKIAHLSRRKDELTGLVSKYNEYFTNCDKMLHLLTDKFMTASRKVSDIRKELIKTNVNIPETNPIPHINRLIEEKTVEARRTLVSRRVCTLPDHFKGQHGVLGMVGHLAYVKDDAAARAISWHIRGDMNCVITLTTEAAQRIYNDTQGRQQVMPLDGVYVAPGHRPLPHVQHNGSLLFQPHGNPVYARNLLIYQDSQDQCITAFKNILGDTLLIDDLASANMYRRSLAQNKRSCPTILTREGNIVSSKGKFGGAHNKIPPGNTFQVFGAPYPVQYTTLQEQISRIQLYQSYLEKMEAAKQDRENHLKTMNCPDAQKNRQDWLEKRQQLETVEGQLASTPPRPAKRGSQDAGEPSGLTTKRARQTSGLT